MSKNANGEGSIYKRMRDGKVVRYEGAITYIGDDGKTKRHTVYGRTRQDVRDKLRKARERLDAGAPVRDATRTVADWLAQWRATTLAVSDRKPATREMYAHLCRKHLEPAPFGAITSGPVAAHRYRSSGAQCRDRGLSDSSVRSVYTVLRLALDGAVRDGLLARNPAAVVKRPGVARREARHAAAVDVTALLNAAEGLRYRDVLVLIAATGMRRGEALALRWTDIDLDAGLLTVRGTLGRVGGKLVVSEPKTDRSRRTVPLGAPLVAMLRAAASSRPPNNSAQPTSGRTRVWCSPPSSGHRSSRATSCGRLRRPPPRQAWKASGCTPCGTRRPWRGSRRACTSRRSPTCSGIRRSRSPATSTGTPATTRRGRRSTG